MSDEIKMKCVYCNKVNIYSIEIVEPDVMYLTLPGMSRPRKKRVSKRATVKCCQCGEISNISITFFTEHPKDARPELFDCKPLEE